MEELSDVRRRPKASAAVGNRSAAKRILFEVGDKVGSNRLRRCPNLRRQRARKTACCSASSISTIAPTLVRKKTNGCGSFVQKTLARGFCAARPHESETVSDCQVDSRDFSLQFTVNFTNTIGLTLVRSCSAKSPRVGGLLEGPVTNKTDQIRRRGWQIDAVRGHRCGVPKRKGARVRAADALTSRIAKGRYLALMRH